VCNQLVVVKALLLALTDGTTPSLPPHCIRALQVLLQEREQEQLAQQLQQQVGGAAGGDTEAAAAAAGGDGQQQQQKQQQKKPNSPLRALILTPTRELALQVGAWAVLQLEEKAVAAALHSNQEC
jgi:hypothetical protein